MLPLVEFTPDLILMDVYMPGCSGLELAAVLRQQTAYLGTPIVFLSTETDVGKQQQAMRQGGDDFLIKPIQLDLLVSAVRNRAERSRNLRSAMVRDSLTGLVNHTKLKEHLNIEVARVGRNGRPLSFVMLDIDHFKAVNDTYGHPAGDGVIKSLARILQQRLRRTDILGRYGGEEFAIILSDTDGVDALRVVDQIRQSFSQIRQYSGTNEFTVTFSAGVATLPPCSDAANLNEVADKALYAAKQAGRNRVILADL
jgi:diguanylate cyclase (GGDEF)-like protein